VSQYAAYAGENSDYAWILDAKLISLRNNNLELMFSGSKNQKSLQAKRNEVFFARGRGLLICRLKLPLFGYNWLTVYF
jgi:hypothetical protein